MLHLLELVRLENYKLTRLPTVNRDLHIYVGDLAAGTRAKDMMLRRLAHSRDTMSGGLERTLNKALDAIDIARMDSKKRKDATPLEFTSTIYPRLRETHEANAIVEGKGFRVHCRKLHSIVEPIRG